jgi:S-formylglutathione hydrolase FrmB
MRQRRRALVFAALGAALLGAWIVARGAIWPDRHGAQISHFTIESRYVHRELETTVILPAHAHAGRPLLVFLHGRGGDQDSELRNGALFKGLARLGRRAPVIAFPNGGGSSYWHDRRSGDWFRYVTREVIGAVERRYHTDRRRVAIGGISMGGFGALDIARLRPGKFCAVGAHSPAIWQTGAQTAAGAFDDARDFRHNDVVGVAQMRPGLFVGPRLWLDAGVRDPFRPGDRAFVSALEAAHVPVSAHLGWHGGHESGYWHRHWPTYLKFYAHALARCR